MSGAFQCSICKEEHFSDRAEEEANAEQVQRFGQESLKQKRSVMCGACFHFIWDVLLPDRSGRAIVRKLGLMIPPEFEDSEG